MAHDNEVCTAAKNTFVKVVEVIKESLERLTVNDLQMSYYFVELDIQLLVNLNIKKNC